MNIKPATFNVNSVDLFTKSPEHINKEMNRRGLFYHSSDRHIEKVARIIWKDAYDAGVNDARRGLVENSVSKQKLTPEPRTQNYFLAHDYYEKRYHVSLTAEQEAFWDWLNEHDFIVPDAILENWHNDVVEIGRIK